MDWSIVGVLVVMAATTLVLAYRIGARAARPAKGLKSVARYTIGMSPGEFPEVLVSFQLDDGTAHGPFGLVPAFAHTFADEVTIASIRSAPRKSSRAILYGEAGANGVPKLELAEEITDDGAVYRHG